MKLWLRIGSLHPKTATIGKYQVLGENPGSNRSKYIGRNVPGKCFKRVSHVPTILISTFWMFNIDWCSIPGYEGVISRTLMW